MNNKSKHRIKKYIELIVMVAICAALLAGAVVTVDAGGDTTKCGRAHISLSLVDPTNATCGESYWKCTNCGKCYLNEDKSGEVYSSEEKLKEDFKKLYSTPHAHKYNVSLKTESILGNSFYVHVMTCSYCGFEKKHFTCTKYIIAGKELSEHITNRVKGFVTGTLKLELNTFDVVSDTPSTCQGPGTNACYQCPVCKEYFSSNGLKAEIKTDVFKPAAPDNHVWKTSIEGHTADADGWVTIPAASCTVDGYKIRSCSLCTYKEQENPDELKAKGHVYGKWENNGSTGQHKKSCTCRDSIYENHKITPVGKTEPTCGVPGEKAHYYCKDCGTCFSDNEGTQVVTKESLKIPALEHDLKWEEKGNSYNSVITCHVLKCQREGCNYEDANSIHYVSQDIISTVVNNDVGELTIEKALKLSLPENTETFKHISKKESTCKEDGILQDYYQCSHNYSSYPECDLAFTSKGSNIEAADGIGNKAKAIINIFNSETPYFTKVDPESLVEHTPDKHSYKIIPYPTDNSMGHIKKCQTSGCEHVDEAFGTSGLQAHNWNSSENDGWEVDQAATCTATGTKHRTCKDCGYTENGTIDKTDHTYVWTYDTDKYILACTGDCRMTKNATIAVNTPQHASVTVGYDTTDNTKTVLTVVPEPGYYVSGITKAENSGAASSLQDKSGEVTDGIAYNSGTATYTFAAGEVNAYVFNVTVENELPLTGKLTVPYWQSDDVISNVKSYESVVFNNIIDTASTPLRASSQGVSIKYWYGSDTELAAKFSDIGLISGWASERIESLNYNPTSNTYHKFGNRLIQSASELVGADIDKTENIQIKYTTYGEGDKYTSYTIKGTASYYGGLATKSNQEIFAITLTDTCKVTVEGTTATGFGSFNFDNSDTDYVNNSFIYKDKKDEGADVAFSATPAENFKLSVSTKSDGKAVEKNNEDNLYHITVKDDETIKLKFVPANLEETETNGSGDIELTVVGTIDGGVKTEIKASPETGKYIKGIKITDQNGAEVNLADKAFEKGKLSGTFDNLLANNYNIEIEYGDILPKKNDLVISVHDKIPSGTDLAKYIVDSLIDANNMPKLYGDGEGDPKFENVFKVEYFASNPKLLEYEDNQLVLTLLRGIGYTGWEELGASGDAKAQGNILTELIDKYNLKDIISLDNLSDTIKSRLEEILAEEDIHHAFGTRPQELIRITYTPPANENTFKQTVFEQEVDTTDQRPASKLSLTADTYTVKWDPDGIDLYEPLFNLINKVEPEEGEGTIETKDTDFSIALSSVSDDGSEQVKTEGKDNINKLNAGKYSAVITYGGSIDYKPSSGTVSVVIEKADVTKFEVENNIYTYNGKEQGAVVTSEDKNGNKIPYILISAGVDSRGIVKALLRVDQETNIEVLGFTAGSIYKIIKSVMNIKLDENGTITIGELIEELNKAANTLDGLISSYEKNETTWDKIQEFLNTNKGTQTVETMKTVSDYLHKAIEYLTIVGNTIGMDAEITIDHNPINAGIYGIYGFVLDKNYNYDYDMGYVTIKPVDKYNAKWNDESLEEKVYLTSDQVAGFDFGAKLYEKENPETVANSPITYIVFGITNEKEIELKRTTDPEELKTIFATPGTYKEVVIGNEVLDMSRTVTITKPYAEWSAVKLFTQIKEKAFALITELGTKVGNEALAGKIIKMINNIKSSLATLFDK